MERQTVLDDLDHWAKTKPEAPCLIDLHCGEQHAISWSEALQAVTRASSALYAHFGRAGKKAAILSKNRSHWLLADLAMLRAGTIVVPVFTTMRHETFHYVLDFTDVEVLFLGESTNWHDVKPHVPDGITIVTFPGVDPSEGDITWDAFLQKGAAAELPPLPDPDSPATIICTSGTTGKPKGVMHSLNSLRQATLGLISETHTQPGWRFFSYLPLAHLAERLIIELHCFHAGGTIYFNENLETFSDDLAIAKPNYFFGVPRIWEKMVQAVIAGTGGDETALKSLLTSADGGTVAAGIREKMGLSYVETMVTTTAPTPPNIKEWFQLFGLTLQDGYGQTEILPITYTPKNCKKLGSVGRPLEGVEVKISSEGELLAKAPGRCLGYYNAPDKTAETFRDGWVHTGDRASIDNDGYIVLKGRVKETFKTAKGKYVAPAPIESQFLHSNLIDQACIVGHGLPQPVLICVQAEGAQQNGTSLTDKIKQLTTQINEGLEQHARVGAVIVAEEPWAIENGILTHTLKVRRDRVHSRYEAEIAEAGSKIGTDQALFFLNAG